MFILRANLVLYLKTLATLLGTKSRHIIDTTQIVDRPEKSLSKASSADLLRVCLSSWLRCWTVTAGNAAVVWVVMLSCVFSSLQVRSTWWSQSGVWLWLLWSRCSALCSCLWGCARCSDSRRRSMEGTNDRSYKLLFLYQELCFFVCLQRVKKVA